MLQKENSHPGSASEKPELIWLPLKMESLQEMPNYLSMISWATSLSLSCVGEGNGNPLQCSCLENPRDGGAWWAAIFGVTQSRTRLKWLSSKCYYRNLNIVHITSLSVIVSLFFSFDKSLNFMRSVMFCLPLYLQNLEQ